MRYETEASWNKYDAEAEREHGPYNDCEVYWSADSDLDEMCITTNEREDFESEMGIKIDSDVLPLDTFEKLVNWVKENNLLHEEKG